MKLKLRQLLFFLCLNIIGVQAQELATKTVLLMGSRFDLTVVAEDQAACQFYLGVAEQEITRIENLISDC